MPKKKTRKLAGKSRRGPQHRYVVGDKVKVIGMAPVIYPPGMKDELGTERLFKSMIGKVYTVKGFDRYGHIELRPTRLDSVWIEAEYLKLRKRIKRKRLK